MSEYRVKWDIDIYADTPREAAEKALEIQRDSSSTATVFRVFDEDGSITLADLAETEMTEPNYAKEQAKAQYESICGMVAALEVDYDRLDELRTNAQAAEANPDDPEDYPPLDADDQAEYEALQAAAGDCENQDAARDRIQEDPLSVQVRSGWHSPCNDRMDERQAPEEFEILLCTGGPAVRIMGELDECGQPYRAWLEYQDWGTPWIRYFGADQDALLTYCREFYFGG